MKTVINSFNHAISGIMQAFKLEKNMKIHFVLMVAVIITAVMTHVTRFELIALVISLARSISSTSFRHLRPKFSTFAFLRLNMHRWRTVKGGSMSNVPVPAYLQSFFRLIWVIPTTVWITTIHSRACQLELRVALQLPDYFNFKLLAGGLIDLNGGFVYNLRNGNNPAQARAYACLDPRRVIGSVRR